MNLTARLKYFAKLATIEKEPYNTVVQNRKDIIFNNFLGGIAWGLGTTIGVAVILTILGLIFHQVHVIPFVGDFVTQVSKYVNTHQ